MGEARGNEKREGIHLEAEQKKEQLLRQRKW